MQLIVTVIAVCLLAGTAWALPLASIDGTAATSTGIPAVSSCGVSPSVAGTDMAGVITVGTGVTVLGCTLTFSAAMTATPVCVVTPSSALAVGISTSTTALAITMAVTLGGGKLAYWCYGR